MKKRDRKRRRGGGRRITKRFKLLDSRFAKKMLAESLVDTNFASSRALFPLCNIPGTYSSLPAAAHISFLQILPRQPPSRLNYSPPPSDFRLSRATRAYTVNEMKKYLLAKGHPRPALLRKHPRNPGELCWNSKEERVA